MTADLPVIHKLMKTVLNCTKRHFRNFVGIEIQPSIVCGGKVDSLVLQDITAIIDLSGPLNVLVAFSFEMALLAHLVRLDTADLRIEDHEKEAFLLDTAAETINIVLGHSTAALANGHNMVGLSVPIVIKEERRLHRPRGTYFATISLVTSNGILDIIFIAPKHLFGEGGIRMIEGGTS